ncbi:hypothetical protein OCK74_09335 [Chitinophagaceae bacterium LB-8]|uniref:Uncharacterized protein n=1 Tax=Paraflavisolibacter caeni TaxID=2982496 RepID=A0A9X2XVQ9_9BACT|nr:hypothetical protein [Paraflavisolibacter caeni]MCU7549317.1 hypothetical protein [Paraflavisolibacter caeni]
MPYYRIVIWTSRRREPYTGIRQIENYNVDAVQHIMRVKAEETYRRDLIDVEVQMISKTSTAVRKYFEASKKKREAKKWPEDKPFVPALRRRDYFNR